MEFVMWDIPLKALFVVVCDGCNGIIAPKALFAGFGLDCAHILPLLLVAAACQLIDGWPGCACVCACSD